MVAFNLDALPGNNLVAAADVISSETGDCRTIPRLPARGLGADTVGYCCALLPELPVEQGPRSWRLSARPQLLTRRLWDQSARDFELLEEQWGTVGGYTLQLAVVGPWSLVAAIELSNGHRAITDSGALTDITEIYSHGIAQVLNQLQHRFNTQPRIMITEPLLPALAAGLIPGTSDFDPISAINEQRLGQLLHTVVEQLRNGTGAKICLSSGNQQPQMEAMRIAEADGLLVSRKTLTGTSMLDACGEVLAAGLSLAIGCVQLGDDPSTAPRIATDLLHLIEELGLAPDVAATQIEVTCATPLYPASLVTAARALGCATKVQQLLQQ